jgi:UDP-arabinose 4-epimerase
LFFFFVELFFFSFRCESENNYLSGGETSMKVLVTGGAGFIGSHACKALAERGHQPIVYDNLYTGHSDAVRWGPLVVGDILDRKRLDKAFTTYRPEMVLHFAALAYVGESVADPAAYYRVNVGGTLSLLQAMVRHGLQRIVFSSTCATYGIPPSLPIDEATVQSPINPYGYTKLTVEHMLADFGVAHNIRHVALRYFNAAGADPNAELGERHDPETHAIPLAIKAALGLGPKFRVLGTDYPTPDGSAIRDYVHVSDLADAHVKAMHYLEAGGESAAFNLATGVGTSVLELVSAVTEATRRPVPISYLPRRPGDPAILFADATRAREKLGWKPRFVTTGETVETAVRFFQTSGALAN